MINMGIVGGGKGGAAMLRVFRNIKDVRIVGIADKNKEAFGIKFAAEIGIPIYTDFVKLLGNPGLEVVIDVTGNEEVHKKIEASMPENCLLVEAKVAMLMWFLAQQKDQMLSEINKQAQQLAGMGEQLNATVEQVPDIIKDVSEFIRNFGDLLSRSVAEVKKDLRDTDEVLEFIRKVADQTKLLGINAAIEAARAGEHGRGFGVVAGEVRKLADHSAVSVNKIVTIMKNLEVSIGTIINSIEENNRVKERQVVAAGQVAYAIGQLGQLASNMNEFSLKLADMQ